MKKSLVCIGLILVVSLLVEGLAACGGRGGKRVTHKWRKSMANEFNANNLLMKNIILDGEDVAYLPDFLQRFDDQGAWFDHTLRGTRRVNDMGYRQIVTKQTRLRNVIGAQKKADNVLAGISKKLKLNDYVHKKIRLLLLYEIHAFAQKGHYRFELDDQIINDLVSRVVQHVTSGSRPVGRRPEGQRPELEKFKQKSEQQNKELFECQLSAKGLEAELERLHGQSGLDDGVKRGLESRLEEKEKACLDLTLQLTGATRTVDMLDKKIKEAKNNLDRVQLELMIAKDDAAVAKKHVDDLRREIEAQRTLKNMAMTKIKLVEELSAKRELQDKVLLLSKKEKEVAALTKLLEEAREPLSIGSSLEIVEQEKRKELEKELFSMSML